MNSTQEIVNCGLLCQSIYDEPKGSVDAGDLRYRVESIGDGTIAITFRGTANTRNAIRDVAVFPPVRQDGYLSHRGFALALRKLIPAIDTLNLGPEVDVLFTGHSFGGALAALAAKHYNKRAITFGCPAMYFWFASKPTVNHFRVVCDDDPVPKLPLLTGKHTCAPGLVLKDRDHQWVDIEDHFMKEYNRRLAVWGKGMKIG